MNWAQACVPACVLLAAGQGCAAPGDVQRTAERDFAIIDGEASGADEDGVLLLRTVLEDEREAICSASLVAPNLLLTARHCVSYLTEGLFSCSVSGELTNSADGAGRLGLHIPAASIEVYGRERPRSEPLARGQQVISTLSETICTNDLAFVVLDTALELPVVPMRLGRPAVVGEASVMVGYGLEAGQAALDYETQARMRKPGLVVAAVGPDSLEDGVTTVAPRALIVEGPAGCLGDSGGPLLAEATGAVLGVFSLQQGETCSSPAVRHHLVHVPPFELLIAEAFAVAGGEPLLEVEATGGQPAQGGAGTAGDVAVGGAGGDASAPEPMVDESDELEDSGCALSNSGADARGVLASFLLLGALLFGARRRLSGGRRADRQF